MPGSTGSPVFTFKVAGVAYDIVANRVEFTRATILSRDGSPSLDWTIRGGVLPIGADDFRGKKVELWADEGLGSTLIFAGRVEIGPVVGFDHTLGWIRSYSAEGLVGDGNRCPITNPVDGTDAIQFNGNPSDKSYRPALAGRSVGQMLRYVLEGAANAAGLTAAGIGGYSRVPTTPSVAHATVAGGAVSIIIDSPGAGYDPAHAPTVYLYGGDGTYTSASASVDGSVPNGVLTAMVSGSTGYTTAPEVWISPLPIVTLRGLGTLAIVPPYSVTVQGERLMQSLQDRVKTSQPNHWLHVEPDGTLKVYDQRAFNPITLTMNGTGGGGTGTAATATGFVDGSNHLAIMVVGGGSGYTVPPAVTLTGTITGTLGPGGITVTLFGGAVSAISVDSNTDWTTPPGVTVAGPGGGASAAKVDVGNVAITRSVRDCYSRVVVRGGPDVVAVTVHTRTADGGGLDEDFGHDGLSSSAAKLKWKLTDFSQPGQTTGVAQGTATLGSGGAAGTVVSVGVTDGGYGYDPANPPTVKFSAPTSGTTATGHVDGTKISGGVLSTTGTATVLIDNAGSGYGTTAPSVAIAPRPSPNLDSGTSVCGSTLSVTVTSADPLRSWPANYWDQSATGRHATLFLTHAIGSDIDARYSTRIISHSALAAGGSCTLTVEAPLPATNYELYEIVGAAGGEANVWRKYDVSNPKYQGKLMSYFPRPVLYRWADGSAGAMTSFPTATVRYSLTGVPPFMDAPIGMDIDPDLGVIRFNVPTVVKFGTLSKLMTGGATTDGIPCDVSAMLAVNRGNLTATAPADVGGVPQFAGTMAGVDGFNRTLTMTAPSWIDRSNQAGMNAMAADLLDSVKDTTVEGTVPLLGWSSSWFAGGRAVNLDAAGWASPWAAMAAPVVEVAVTWTQQSGSKYLTTLRVSNRRQHFTADQFLRPTPSGQVISGGGGEIGTADWARLDSLEGRLERLFSGFENLDAARRDAQQYAREIRGS